MFSSPIKALTLSVILSSDSVFTKLSLLSRTSMTSHALIESRANSGCRITLDIPGKMFVDCPELLRS